MKRRAALAALAASWAAAAAARAASGRPEAAATAAREPPAFVCWGAGTCWTGRAGEPLQRLVADLAATVPPAPVADGAWLALAGGGLQRWHREGRDWQPGAAALRGTRVHALAAAAQTHWALAAHDDRLSLLDTGGGGVKTYEGTDLERRRRGRAGAVRALDRRRSFVASWPDLGEWWEISLDPDAPPIFDGLVHDYRMKEGIATAGHLGVRRVPLGAPAPSMRFADPRVAWLAGDLGDAVAIVHLDVRRRIASLPIAGARPEASLLVPEMGALRWWLPAGETLNVVDVARWTVVDRRPLPGPARALQAVGGTVWALVGDPPRDGLFAWRDGSWQWLPAPSRATGVLAADAAGRHVLLSDPQLPGLNLLDPEGAVLQHWALPRGAALEGAAWLPSAA